MPYVLEIVSYGCETWTLVITEQIRPFINIYEKLQKMIIIKNLTIVIYQMTSFGIPREKNSYLCIFLMLINHSIRSS